MNKFVVNHELLGFEKVEIDDPRLLEDESMSIIVIDESCNNQLYKYYSNTCNILTSKSKVIMIVVGSEVSIRKTMLMLMINYKNYNVYRVDNIDIVTEAYVKKIIERHPTLLEVQQYIGGDITAYSELNNILFGLKMSVNSGDVESLKTFIENHIESIESAAELIEYLKRVNDSANNRELNNLIESLKDKLDAENRNNAELSKEIKSTKAENLKLNETIQTLHEDLSVANRKLNELKNSSGQAGSVIKSYAPLQLSTIVYKAHSIIYFKEISYVRYVNSLVNNFIKYINETNRDAKIKLIIYDQKVGINGVYKGINTYNTKTYAESKQSIIKNNPRYVVSEPSQIFIEDVVVSSSPIFDIVIIYDRMGMSQPLIEGNNVTKIYVVNSATQYSNVKDALKINANNMIITSSNNVPNGFIIPEIQGYSEGTDSFKISQYKKKSPVNWSGGQEGMIDIIIKKARID